MAHTKRHDHRCQSTPSKRLKSVEGTSQHLDSGLLETEPVHANVDPSFKEELQDDSLSEDEVHDDSSVDEKKSRTYWTIDVINEDGDVRKTNLRVRDVFAMRDGSKVMTRWNSNGQPVGQSAALLTGFLGLIASNFDNFPIMYPSWPKVPKQYKENIYTSTIKTKFVCNDGDNKKYIFTNLSKKWRDGRSKLFRDNYDWEISVEQNCQRHPPSINPDHWAMFLQYRMSSKTMEMADRNAANCQKQSIPHTLGSKSLARKRDELERQHGCPFGRGEMYQIAHKKSDGTFINQEAKEKCEQLQKEVQECSSKNEAFIKVFGKEHPGYVHGMGLGVTPSQVIGCCSQSVNSTSLSVANAKIEKLESEIGALKAQVAEVDALKAQVSEFDSLKAQLAFLMQVVKGNGGVDMNSPRDVRRSSASSHALEDIGAST